MNTTPPSAPDIERAVLCAAMIEKSAITTAYSIIGNLPNAFYSPQHALIWESIVAMHNKNYPVDSYTLSEYMITNNTIEQAGGEEALAGIACVSYSTANVKYHCEVLKEKALLRTLLLSATTLQRECLEENKSSDIIGNFQGTIERVNDANKKHILALDEIMPNVYSRMQEWSETKTQAFGVASGFGIIDRATTGWCPGRLIIFGAKTSDGKTTLALCCALAAAREHRRVLYISTEMNHMDIGLRLQMMGMKTTLDIHAIRNYTVQDWKFVDNISGQLSKLPISVVAYPGIPVRVLGNIIESERRMNDIGLVIVDYLQQVQGTTSESRRLAVESVSMNLKQFAGKYDVPIIALSQFARKEEDFSEPQLSWLRETAGIEQDADQVILIWNPDKKKKEDIISLHKFESTFKNEELRLLLLKKNRHGRLATALVQLTENGGEFKPLDYQIRSKDDATSGSDGQ